MPKKKRVYAVNVKLPKELYDKIHRISDAEERSASAKLRRMIAQLPDIEGPIEAP